MKANRIRVWVGVAAVVLLAASVQAAFVTVGNPGNADDVHGDGYGGVAYTYQISEYETTAGEYATFLNAVAASDPNGLYNGSMDSSGFGCQITRTGSDGS
jgi:hypothetical protein